MKLKFLGISSLVAVTAVVGSLTVRSSSSKHLSQMFAPSVFADGMAPTAIGTLRSNIFLVVGFPSDTVYSELNPEGGPPQQGLTGLIGDIFTTISNSMATEGIKTCNDIPATGTYSGTLSVLGQSLSSTATIGSATKAPPTGWVGAGTVYAKRVEVDAGTLQASIEFNCDRAAGYAVLSIPGDTIENSIRTLNVYFDMEDPSASKMEFGMKVTVEDASLCGGNLVCDVMLLRAQTGASNQFDLWYSSYSYRSSKFQGERGLISGNYSTQQMSSYYTFDSDMGVDPTNATEFTSTQDASGSAGVDFQASTTADLILKGCVDYDTPATNPASTALCDGFELAEPSAPVFSAGNFSYDGLVDLAAQIEAP